MPVTSFCTLKLLPLSLFTTLGPLGIFPSCYPNLFFLCLRRIIFTKTCIHFLKYWTWAKWEAGKKVSVLAHSVFTLQSLQPSVDNRMASWGVWVFLTGVSGELSGAILDSLCVPLGSPHFLLYSLRPPASSLSTHTTYQALLPQLLLFT